MAVDVAIREALAARLATLAISPALPVAWENVRFEGPDHGWVEAQIFRSGKTRLGNSTRHRHFGFMQVTVVAPREIGAVKPDEIAAAVAEHFPVDLRLPAGGREVRVTSEPALATGLSDESWWRVPVTVPFELYD